MKRFFGFCFLVAAVGLILTSCTSSQQMSISRMRHSEPAFSEIPFDSYTVLERVSGEGKVSNVVNSVGLFEGDTGLYGSLDAFDAIYLNMDQATVIRPKTPYEAALANAIYQMVEKADALKADAVIFVRTKTKIVNENGKATVSVKVNGAAVKLK